MILHYEPANNKHDLTEFDGLGLLSLVEDITEDLIHFHCFNRDEDVDNANIALTELMEYIVFNRGGIE